MTDVVDDPRPLDCGQPDQLRVNFIGADHHGRGDALQLKETDMIARGEPLLARGQVELAVALDQLAPGIEHYGGVIYPAMDLIGTSADRCNLSFLAHRPNPFLGGGKFLGVTFRNCRLIIRVSTPLREKPPRARPPRPSGGGSPRYASRCLQLRRATGTAPRPLSGTPAGPAPGTAGPPKRMRYGNKVFIAIRSGAGLPTGRSSALRPPGALTRP